MQKREKIFIWTSVILFSMCYYFLYALIEGAQDAADAAARVHDMQYDEVEAAGINGVFSESTIQADINLVRASNKIIEMYNNGETDPFTGGKVSQETKERAEYISAFFTAVLINKALDKTHVDTQEVTEFIELHQLPRPQFR